jgi:hypothetical protein
VTPTPTVTVTPTHCVGYQHNVDGTVRPCEVIDIHAPTKVS